jgi:hypothetical protein
MLYPVAAYLSHFDYAESDNERRTAEDDAAYDNSSQDRDRAPDDSLCIDKESCEAAAASSDSIDIDALLEAERAAFAEYLNAERQRWTQEEGARLGNLFRLTIERSFAGLEMRLAAVLAPLLEEKLREQMVKQFCSSIRTALADKKDPVITFRGPSDLLARILDDIELHGVAANAVDDSLCDVVAHFEETIFETRIKEFLTELTIGISDNEQR